MRNYTIFLLAALPVAICEADTISVTSVADTFVAAGSTDVSAGSPDSNYGAAGAMMISASGSAKGEQQALIKFDLSTVKSSLDAEYGEGNWIVTSITLSLGTNFGTQGVQPNNPIFNSINAGNFSIDWLADDSWVEGTGNPSSPTTDGVTYNTLANYVSSSDVTLGTFNWTAPGNIVSSWTLSLDSDFVDDVSEGNLVSFRGYAADSDVGYLFNSRSYGTAANRPTLSVSAIAIPEPGGYALLMMALGTLWMRRPRA